MYLQLKKTNKHSKERSDLCIFKSKSYAKLWIKRIGFAMCCNFVHICTSKGYNGEILTQLLMKFLINQSLERVLQCSVTKTDCAGWPVCWYLYCHETADSATSRCCCWPQVLNHSNDLAQQTHSLFLTQKQFTNQSVCSLVDIPRSYHVFGGCLMYS